MLFDGLALLLQIKVTLVPTETEADGSMVMQVSFGGTSGQKKKHL